MFGLSGIVVGILLFLIGIFLFFFFPGNESHQPGNFSIMGIIIGFILLVAGGILIFA